MRPAVTRFGFIWFSLALLCHAGCQPDQVEAKPGGVSQGEADVLLRQVPEELRWTEPPEDPAAQERYIKVLKIVRRGAGSGYGRPESQDSSNLSQIRQILKSGPVQVGFDEGLALGSAYNGTVAPALVSSLLFESAAAAVQAKKTDQAADDIKLAFDWMLQTTDSGSIDMGRRHDFFNVLNRISQAVQPSQADRKKLLAVLPSEEKLLDLQKDQVKQILESRIYALAGITAPKKDLAVSRQNRFFGYGAGVSLDPKASILVPPFGTLDKEETLKSLVEMARLTVLTLDSTQDSPMGMQRQLMTDFVKWLPTPPPSLTTGTKAERDYVQKKIDVYVMEMNKGENTLGRQFLQSWQSYSIDARPSLSQTVEDFRRSLEASIR